MSAVLNNQIHPVSETRLSSLAMTSVLSHWLSAKHFVLSLYKCDTTRMVGRSIYSTAIYTSLLTSFKIYLHILHRIKSPTYTCTAHFSLITHIYLHSLHLIKSPTYTHLAYSSLIPHIYLHSLHLKYPPHIPTQPTSH